jgi:hypothetical protein
MKINLLQLAITGLHAVFLKITLIMDFKVFEREGTSLNP